MKYIQSNLCSYTKLREDQHKFVFHASNREALKEWANHVEELQLQHQWYNRSLMRLFIDARSSVGLSVRAFFEYLSDYNRPYPQLTPPHIRIAFLHSPHFEVKDVYQQFADLMTVPTTIKFFEEEAKAMEWLQSE